MLNKTFIALLLTEAVLDSKTMPMRSLLNWSPGLDYPSALGEIILFTILHNPNYYLLIID